MNKIEVFLLLGLIYLVSIDKIHKWYLSLLSNDMITPLGLSALIMHVFILSMYLSGPFILLYLIPKQTGLQVFRTKPLTTIHLFQLTGYYYFKYQLISIIVFIICISSLFGISWFSGLVSVFSFLIFSMIVFIMQFMIYKDKKNNFHFWVILLIIIVSYQILFALLYFYTQFFWIFDSLVAAGTVIILWYKSEKMNLIHLEITFTQKSGWPKFERSVGFDFSRIPHFLPAGIQAIFNKELLGLWRNPSYRRLKIITFFSYVFLMIAIYISQLQNKDIFMMILTGITIWLHYSNYFNEKYVLPEPEWYFRTVPFRFHQLWISKFMVEFIFIIAIITGYWILLFISGISFYEQLNLLAIIFIFSIIVLLLMLNFQIMFYDDPRLAGYAYHFTILFLLIMIDNYRLVGPLISIILLSFYFYKSYRYFNS